MFKRRDLSIPVFFSVGLALYALLTRYMISPIPLLVLSGIVLGAACLRVGRPLKVPRLLAFVLVAALIGFLNFTVFVLKVHAEQALVYFLIILMLAKSFSLCKFKDYVQVMALSALSVMAAGAFNSDPSFPAVLVLYLCSAGYWIFKFHLATEYVAHFRQKQVAPVAIIHTEHPTWFGPFVRTSLVTCAIALILFSLIPRHTPAFNLATQMLGQQMSSTGFSQEMMLGEMSLILEDKTPVLRAKYVPEDGQRKNYTGVLYLRGAVYDTYVKQGNSWQWQEERDTRIKRLESTATLAEPTLVQPPLGKKSTQNLWRISFQQAISSNVFVVDRPLAVAANQSLNLSYNRLTNIISGGSQFLPKGLTYQLLTEQAVRDMNVLPLTTQPVEEEEAEKENIPAEVRKAASAGEVKFESLGLIPDLRRGPGDDGKVTAISFDVFRPFAEKAVAFLPANASPREKIQAIENWLKTEFRYTLDNRDVDRSVEPVMDFLARRKKGHCEYFASALVLLARSLGYEARVVAGFKDGEFNSFGDYYLVRNCDAHAWAEVLIPGVGWLRCDPTPPARDDLLRSQENGSFKWFWDIVDLMQYSWTDKLASTEGTNRKEFMKGLHQQMMGPEGTVDEEENPWSLRTLWKWLVGLIKGRNYKSIGVQVLHFILAISLLAMVLFIFRIVIDVMFILWDTVRQTLRRRWEKRYGLIRYCPVDFYRRLLLWLAARGLVRQRHETAEEFVGRLSKARPDLEKNMQFITKVYLAIRFGGKRVTYKQKEYLVHLSELIQQAILTTRVVTRDVLVEKPVPDSPQKPAEPSDEE